MIRIISKVGFLLIFATLVVGVIFYQLVRLEFFGPIPTTEAITNIHQQKSSIVYSSSGEVLGKFYIQDRNPIKYDQIPDHLIDALIATEDHRFYTHNGVDFWSLGRVLIKSIFGSSNSGGSTITQQLAKNLYPRLDYDILYYPINKTREIIIAGRLEAAFSKEEVLELYLNTVSFGSNVYGLETASEVIFDKHATELNLEESATLVGMLKATTTYHPVLHPDNSKRRRNLVLSLMKDQGKIRDNEFLEAIEKPLVTIPKWNEDDRSYFLTQVQKESQRVINAYNKDHGTTYNLFTSGLAIETTLDEGIQLAAENAVEGHMKKLQKSFDAHWDGKLWDTNAALLQREIEKISGERSLEEMTTARDMLVYTPDGPAMKRMSTIDSLKYYLQQLHAGLISVDPQSGKVLAWVGGIDFQYFPYDHVSIHSKRQVGSIFKPIVYASALEADLDPCTYYSAEQVSYSDKDGEWSPGNADGKYEGEYTMSEALESSVNTVSVKILNDVGIGNTVLLANAMGIESDIPMVPSIALGTPSISLTEMATAYAVFANDGFRISPYLIQRIEAGDGQLLYEHKQNEPERVMSEKSAKEMVYFLKKVVDSGTGHSLRTVYKLPNDLGGKTGTTQSNADGWFISVSPQMVTGVWVGGTYPSISFRETRLGQGATMALPIVGSFYQDLNSNTRYAHVTKPKFEPLPADIEFALNCDPFEEDLNFFQRLFSKNEKNKTEKPESEKKGFLSKVKSIFKKKNK